MKRLIFSISAALVILTACDSVAERNEAGNSALFRQDYTTALSAYQQAQVIEPDRAEAYYNAAIAHIRLNEYEQAIAALEQALITAEGDLAARAYYNLGNAYAMLRQDAGAINAYRAGLLIDPADVDMRYNLEIVQLRYIQPTPTAQQIESEEVQPEPTPTPTDDPADDFDSLTTTPPAFDPTPTPDMSDSEDLAEDTTEDLLPEAAGGMTLEQAERILDQIAQDQQSLREFMQEMGGAGETLERDW